MKLWLVYEGGSEVVFHGLFRRKQDAKQAYQTEHENLRASGNEYAALDIQEFRFEPGATWSSE
jgi:hypothetical protein